MDATRMQPSALTEPQHCLGKSVVRYEVLTAATMKIPVFCYMMACSLVDLLINIYQIMSDYSNLHVRSFIFMQDFVRLSEEKAIVCQVLENNKK
jgi:hypothetical protein